MAAFGTLGFQSCDESGLEPSYANIALYALEGIPTHAARQLPDGRWSSKLGRSVDIAHDLDALDGSVYGMVLVFLRREESRASEV